MWLGLVRYVRLYRTAFFTGPFGTGKTLGAIALAMQLVSEEPHLRLLSNIPVSSSSILDVGHLCDTIILLDEGRRYLDARRWSSRDFNIDYLRHLNSFLLVSAAFDVDARLRRLVVERIFPFLPGPAWFYRVRLYDEQSGRLAILLLPQAFWGMYPRRYMLTASEDSFYVLLEEFFSQIAYVQPEISASDKARIQEIVSKTISTVRHSRI